ncbi:dihydroorotase, mitochondrial isoform X2 [Olea europaea subsp. europaea]|uniref:Dihydroorotase, mitochondrial isoform X2 n=1 Tax=Olea europaea subsp. europaea TaxID=158383 RepID=A0A8S0S4X7_OLEEU|nr:dihydroorotase, mitochondrial isoform X2 [Olea europaea subsp. europaea]
MPIMDWINFTYHQGWANNSCQSESPSSSPTIHLNCQRRFYSLANSLCLKEPFSCSLVCIMLKTPFFPCKVTSPRIVSIRQQYHLMWQEQKWSSQSLNLMFGIYIFVMVNFLKDVVCHSAGATTNSQHGGFGKCLPVVEEMVQQNMPLLVRGEVTSLDVDVFDLEKVFIEEVFSPLIQKFPRVKVVMEHITTKDAVNFVESCDDGFVAATVTPQHLSLNRNSIFQEGLQPHSYRLPILKRETSQCAFQSFYLMIVIFNFCSFLVKDANI